MRASALAGDPEPVDRIEDVSVPGPGAGSAVASTSLAAARFCPLSLYAWAAGWSANLDSHESV